MNTPPLVILNLFQDLPKSEQSLEMLKQVQHDEYHGGQA